VMWTLRRSSCMEGPLLHPPPCSFSTCSCSVQDFFLRKNCSCSVRYNMSRVKKRYSMSRWCDQLANMICMDGLNRIYGIYNINNNYYIYLRGTIS
jgi:hypothetical protein